MRNKAGIIAKIVIEGSLETKSPLIIGAGETDGVIDSLILKDKNEQPFIPGTSLAGVLRDTAYRRFSEEIAKSLFGDSNAKEAEQSAIVINDVKLDRVHTVVRDGVGIDDYTGVGINSRKYDYEALDKGAVGSFKMVVTLREGKRALMPEIQKAVQELADILMSGIHIGALTTKGFGLTIGKSVTVSMYDFTKPEAVKGWLLQSGAGCKVYQAKAAAGIAENDMLISADFAIDSSLIVRTASDDENDKLAAVQLKSGDDFVIPGTTVKGIIRHQAVRIMDKLNKPLALLDSLMGTSEGEKLKSRLYTEEVYFKQGVREVRQSRNRIDRFTGGTVDSALFTTRPVWQEKSGTPVLHMKLRLRDCQPWEAGLMLFILRDMWNGDVAFGGEKSIGRGRLHGVKAVISYKGNYELTANGDKLKIVGDKNQLEEYAKQVVCADEVAE